MMGLYLEVFAAKEHGSQQTHPDPIRQRLPFLVSSSVRKILKVLLSFFFREKSKQLRTYKELQWTFSSNETSNFEKRNPT